MKRHTLLLLLAGVLFSGLAPAQKPAKPLPPQTAAPDARNLPQQEETPQFTAPVTNILVPVKVFDRSGTFVTGISENRFHLYDNGKEQKVRAEETLTPISLVIAIQANHEVEKILPYVNRIGNLIQPLMLGEQGEAAVIAFDARVRLLQDFTSDADKITDAVRKIQAGSMSSRLTDAVDMAEHMLRNRPKDHQRVILLISESNDSGSEHHGLETLNYLQNGNVTLYIITMSRILGQLTASPVDPDPAIMPPATYFVPPIIPATPTTLEHTYGSNGNSAQFVPMIKDIFKDTKAFVKAPAADVFAKGTGGTKYDFHKGHGLEDAIQQMAGELHLQYMLSYSPNNKDEAGWHDLMVEVEGADKTKEKVRTRPGYWMPSNR